MQKKYMILCVAGQSNAVGYDESKIPADYMAQFDCDRIFQLGFWGGDNLQVIPLGPCAQNFQDMRPYGHPENPGIGTRGGICASSTNTQREAAVRTDRNISFFVRFTRPPRFLPNE